MTNRDSMWDKIAELSKKVSEETKDCKYYYVRQLTQEEIEERDRWWKNGNIQ